MEFHLRSGGIEVLHYTASSMNSSSTAGNRASYCKIFETQSSSPCARTREKDLTVPTIGGSSFCPLLVKSLPEYCSTGLYNPSSKNDGLNQCGFRANRGTRDMVFILRRLQKKCREQNKGLYAPFVALTQSAGKVHGGFLGVLAVPENSPTWRFNCTKTNAAKSDSTETRQSPYSYPLA